MKLLSPPRENQSTSFGPNGKTLWRHLGKTVDKNILPRREPNLILSLHGSNLCYLCSLHTHNSFFPGKGGTVGKLRWCFRVEMSDLGNELPATLTSLCPYLSCVSSQLHGQRVSGMKRNPQLWPSPGISLCSWVPPPLDYPQKTTWARTLRFVLFS